MYNVVVEMQCFSVVHWFLAHGRKMYSFWYISFWTHVGCVLSLALYKLLIP